MIKILHTADWHLGRNLYGRKRYEEFGAFLDWLASTMVEHSIDVLLVSGDVFDTTTPSNRAQELYYRFLCRVAGSDCRHVVVTGGNHDSPTFLNAPKDLLEALNVHVVGCACENPGEEVRLLRDPAGSPELIVCAVPYLRDRDIRSVGAGETIEEKERNLVEGIRRHYAVVGQHAEAMREAVGEDIPIVGMGHLFTADGKTVDGDGVRDLYVGSLAHVTAEIFPACMDYVALGHLHLPQVVGERERIRYSGSPIPMGFGEAGQSKEVCLVKFAGKRLQIESLRVPVFQALGGVRGDWETIVRDVRDYLERDEPVWLEVVYEGTEPRPDLRTNLEALVDGSGVEILRIRDRRIFDEVMGQFHGEETLERLTVSDVFTRCLEARGVPEAIQSDLRDAFGEVLKEIEEEDARAE